MLQAEVGARLQKQPPTLIWNAIWNRVLREKEPTLLLPSHYILLLPESQQGAAKPKLAARQLWSLWPSASKAAFALRASPSQLLWNYTHTQCSVPLHWNMKRPAAAHAVLSFPKENILRKRLRTAVTFHLLLIRPLAHELLSSNAGYGWNITKATAALQSPS